jgi:hypothetical protein
MTIDKGKEQVLYAYDDVSFIMTLDDPIERSVEPKHTVTRKIHGKSERRQAE